MSLDCMVGKLEKPLPLFFRGFKYRMDDIYRQLDQNRNSIIHSKTSFLTMNKRTNRILEETSDLDKKEDVK